MNTTHGRLERPGSTCMMPHINIFLHPYTDRSLCHTQLDHEHLYVCIGTDGKCGEVIYIGQSIHIHLHVSPTPVLRNESHVNT